ncbi:MAG: TM2 domain-containing protein [Oscillospiraceae bacterium]|nr:TM2 domain-containing protein [Oscillospiraceae bacterium]
MDNTTTATPEVQQKTKFCKHCGAKIAEAAVICPQCGCQVEEIKKAEQPSIVINNANTNTNTNTNTINAAALGVRTKNKWVAFFLCLFLGYLGVHKFYEGRVGLGIVYLITFGLFGIGWFIDCLVLLFKPNPYYVR